MIDSLLDAREEYIAKVRAELLGPGSEISWPDAEHELISSDPAQRYSIGILYPQKAKINGDNDETIPVNNQETVEETQSEEEPEEPEKLDEEEEIEAKEKNRRRESAALRYENPEEDEADEEEDLDDDVSLASQNMPSSVGLTFFVKGNSEQLSCKIKFSTYKKARAEHCRVPFTPINPTAFVFPEILSEYVTYEKETGFLRLTRGGLAPKWIRQVAESGKLGEDTVFLKDAIYKLYYQLSRGYYAEPHECTVVIDFSAGDYSDNNKNLCGTSAKITGLRRKISNDISSVTIVMVNEYEEDRYKPENCIFRPYIEITSEDNDIRFVDYSHSMNFKDLDEEEQALELQYRDKKTYASGLGTSVGWSIDADGNGKIFNDFFPMTEIPGMDFNIPAKYQVPEKALSMKHLSDLDYADKEHKLNELKNLTRAYETWISEIEEKSKAIITEREELRSPAEKTIIACRKALQRMNAGLDMLGTDQKAWNSFELANRAMYMQRVHLNLQRATAEPPRYPDDAELGEILRNIDYRTADDMLKDKYACKDRYLWRPFQIAFLLMSINSVRDNKDPDRDIIDLIWFPTGGGKTEAYLGLTAFTIFYRRLAHLPTSDGTTVIMRYTLRLLAAQQFTRASTLICACEFIRYDATQKKSHYGKYPLGTAPITIGLWIGGDHTPNRDDKAKSLLKNLTDATADNIRDKKDRYNKFQVLKCPWCGTKMVKDPDGKRLIGQFGYRMSRSKFELFCPQEDCFFYSVEDSLPVQVVDEELYKNPPTLLFGTVDKFAMLPWKQEIGKFFGVGTENRPPELIIQDELHLISGPLGTMVGLYESAIDLICSEKGSSPKIVASTATIRRAAEQCSALYNRDVSQFPPPGIDSGDSFFAREAIIDHASGKFGRVYIGLMPSGKTKAMMENRTISVLLQKVKDMDTSDFIKDKYWTLTGYFNSLRDLGKCSNLVDDDIKDSIGRLAKRTGLIENQRKLGKADELTSRVSTTELNETLDKLEKLTYSKENIEAKRYASNVLLATNMISVGIDVARLNVMLMVGQPKLTSEYIQASSRVGREFPGIVLVQYDGGKSRDRSHYEQFKAYHQSYYKFVEPTGATPFSKPARDRALHAVAIAIMRNLEPDLAPENGAAGFEVKNYTGTIEKIKTALALRDQEIVARMNNGMQDESSEIRAEIDQIMQDWEDAASCYEKDHFYYGSKFTIKPPEEGEGRLLKPYGNWPGDTMAMDTMTSMRNVDVAVPGNVLIWE